MPFRLRPLRFASLLLCLGVAASALAGCGHDPLLIDGRVDVMDATADATYTLEFPSNTRLVRSTQSVDERFAGSCTVSPETFGIGIYRTATGTGIRTLRIGGADVSVDLEGTVYSATPDGTSCIVDDRLSDHRYGYVSFDVDCVVSDDGGQTLTVVGGFALEGCNGG